MGSRKKTLISFLLTMVFVLTLQITALAAPYTGSTAFYSYRIRPYNNIKYYIDTNVTNSYMGHTAAYTNAISKFDNLTNSDIGFTKSNYSDSTIIMTSVSSSRVYWLGLCTTWYSIPDYSVKSATIEINDYEARGANLSGDYIKEVALHEMGHAFGFVHQPQSESGVTIMAPYLTPYSNAARVDLLNVDKSNLRYAYPGTNTSDWAGSWAKNEIKYAMDNGWINKTDKFRPKDEITRAEFIKIVNKAFGYTSKASSESFTDVKSSDWWYNDVLIALKAGYINGKLSKFRPNDKIRREEVASIITSIKNNKDNNLDKIKRYADYKSVSEWARSSVEGAIEAGYMGKGSTNFRPLASITREEAIATLYRIVVK